MDGSSLMSDSPLGLSALGLKVRTNWPEIATGWAADKATPTLGWSAGDTVSDTPVILTAEVCSVTKRLKSFVVTTRFLSLTSTLKLKLPNFAGVPLITPVGELSVRPFGSVPAAIDQA